MMIYHHDCHGIARVLYVFQAISLHLTAQDLLAGLALYFGGFRTNCTKEISGILVAVLRCVGIQSISMAWFIGWIVSLQDVLFLLLLDL